MLKPGRNVNLARKPLAADDTREVSRQDLQRDSASVPQVSREVNDRHASAPKLTLDRIPIVNDSGELVWCVGQDFSARLVWERQL